MHDLTVLLSNTSDRSNFMDDEKDIYLEYAFSCWDQLLSIYLRLCDDFGLTTK